MGDHRIMDLDGRIVVKMKGNVMGLIVIVFVIVRLQMAVHWWSVDRRGLGVAHWVQLATMQHCQPSRNMQELVKWLVWVELG